MISSSLARSKDCRFLAVAVVTLESALDNKIDESPVTEEKTFRVDENDACLAIGSFDTFFANQQNEIAVRFELRRIYCHDGDWKNCRVEFRNHENPGSRFILVTLVPFGNHK